MTNLWWLQDGWKETCCANCGNKIWPEGDPDWGLCFACFTQQLEYDQQIQQEDDFMSGRVAPATMENINVKSSIPSSSDTDTHDATTEGRPKPTL